MNILMICNAFPPVYMGGETSHLHNLVHGLAARGHRIFVVYPRRGVNGTTTVTLSHIGPKVDVYCIWLPNQDKHDSKLNNMLMAVVGQILQSGIAIDVIHCHSNRCVPAIRSLSEAYAIPVVSTVHAIHIPMVYEVKRKKGVAVSSGDEKEYLQDVSRTSALCHYSKRIVAVSQAMTRLIERYYRANPAKIRLVYNGVNVKQLVAPPDDNQVNPLKSKLGLKGRKIVLFSGRMEPIKGICRFAEAAKAICISREDMKFIFLGNGSADRWLKSYLSDCSNVSFIDWLPSEKATAFYHLADIVVVPSLIEPFGLVAVEAMACRCCVVTSNADGLNEIVADGVNGLKVPLMVDAYGDRDISQDEIRKRIQWALVEHVRRAEVVDRGVKRAWDFTRDRMAEGIEGVYREL